MKTRIPTLRPILKKLPAEVVAEMRRLDAYMDGRTQGDDMDDAMTKAYKTMTRLAMRMGKAADLYELLSVSSRQAAEDLRGAAATLKDTVSPEEESTEHVLRQGLQELSREYQNRPKLLKLMSEAPLEELRRLESTPPPASGAQASLQTTVGLREAAEALRDDERVPTPPEPEAPSAPK